MTDRIPRKRLETYPSEKCPITYNMIGTIVPSIILNDPEYKKWFYSNYIHLSIEPEFYVHETRHPLGIFPDNYIRQLNSASFSNILTEVYLPNQLSKLNADNVIDFIIDAIEKDYFPLIWLDVSKLKGTKWYQNRKYRHWAFCVGYDMDQEMILIQDFDKKGQLNIISVSFSNMKEAFYSDIEEMHVPDSLGFCKILGRGNMILLSRIPNYKFQLKPLFLKAELQKYLDGTDIGQEYLLMLPYKENVYWGINVYQYLKTYLKVQADERDKIDLRSFIALKEHKQIMCDRFAFFMEQGITVEEKGCRLLEEVHQDAELLFLKIMKYNEKKNRSDFEACVRLIDSIAEKEVSALNLIIQNI